MMKKVLFIAVAAASILFYSCGTTKTDVPDLADAPEIQEAAEAIEEQSQQQTEETSDEQETPAVEQEEESEASESIESYPPLEEIEEPEVTDISIEELIKLEELKAQQEKEKAEEAAKIEEPVPAEETTPPVLENTGADSENKANAEDVPEVTDEITPQTEVQPSIEPTIEIQEEAEAVEEKPIVPSRSVTLKKGETLIVTYPGNGWVYMGSTSEYNNLASRGRKLGSTDTKYTLLAKEAGTQIHHFYKVDNLTGEYIDDYLEVTVLDKKGKSNTTVNAPDYSKTVPKKAETPAKSTATKNKEAEKAKAQQAQEEAAKAEQTTPAKESATDSPKAAAKETSKAGSKTTSKETAKPAPVQTQDDDDDVVVIVDEDTFSDQITVNLDALMKDAQAQVSNKDYKSAYNTLQQYLEQSVDGRDEALYLLGQILEADSPLKNIKEAINTYQTLCDNYPASKYWENANKRIIYLKRFYIDIH